MAYLPITLGVSRTLPHKDGKSQAEPQFHADPDTFRVRVFERDNYTCKCCGFRAEEFQEILFLNGDRGDLRMENAATTCIFCNQCFDLNKVGKMQSGVLIWLPEITQAVLHHIIRAVYVARVDQGPAAKAARQALDTLMARREQARLRVGTDNPKILGAVLEDFLSEKTYMRRDEMLKGIRLLPLDRRVIQDPELGDYNPFQHILNSWRTGNGPFSGTSVREWPKLYMNFKDQLAA